MGLAFFLLYYLWPLKHPSQNLAGLPSDTLAHAPFTAWFCDNFYQGNFHNPSLFTPFGLDLSTSYDAPLLFTLACPLQSLGPIAMFNFMAAIQMIAIITVSFLVARTYIKNHWLRLGFIFLYSFSAFTLTRQDYHLNILSTVWTTPLIFMLYDRLDLTRLKPTLVAFTLTAITFLTAWQNIANLTPLIAILIFIKLINLRDQKGHLLTALKHLLFGSLLLVTLTLYFIAPMLKGHNSAVTDINYSYPTHADLSSYLVPYFQNLFAPLTPTTWLNHHYFEQNIAPDSVITILFFIFLYRDLKTKRLKYPLWLGFAFLYLVLSFGAKITWLETPLLSLPYYPLLAQIPPFITTRTPARFGIVVIFFITLYVTKKLESRLKAKSLAPLLFTGYAIFITTIGSNNLQYSTFAYTAVLPMETLHQIGQDPQDTSVLQLPIDLYSDQTPNFMQIFHGKKLINAYLSYRAENSDSLTLLNQDPLLTALRCLNPTPLPRTELVDHLKQLNIGYIILNHTVLNQTQCQPLRFTITTTLSHPQLTKLHQDNYFSIYRID
jgi:hypothetical protein